MRPYGGLLPPCTPASLPLLRPHSPCCYFTLSFLFDARTKPIYVYLNSTGCLNDKGQAISADNDFYAIWAALGFTRAPLYTGVTWKAQNQAAVLLAAGEKGHRYSFPHAKISTAPPILNRVYGQTVDAQLQANELDYATKYYAAILARATGKDLATCQREYLYRKRWVGLGLLMGHTHTHCPRGHVVMYCPRGHVIMHYPCGHVCTHVLPMWTCTRVRPTCTCTHVLSMWTCSHVLHKAQGTPSSSPSSSSRSPGLRCSRWSSLSQPGPAPGLPTSFSLRFSCW